MTLTALQVLGCLERQGLVVLSAQLCYLFYLLMMFCPVSVVKMEGEKGKKHVQNPARVSSPD